MPLNKGNVGSNVLNTGRKMGRKMLRKEGKLGVAILKQGSPRNKLSL